MDNWPRADRNTFILKLGAALALVVVGDRWAYAEEFVGPGLGLFAICWTALTVASNRALRHNSKALLAAGVAAAFALVLIEDPSVLAWSLFGAALLMAATLPRRAGFDDAWRWSQQIVLLAFGSLAGPVRDGRRWQRLRAKVPRKPLRRFVPLLGLPLIGSAIFISLFALANPLIADTLGRLQLPSLEVETAIRVIWWIIVFTLVWATLRPRRVRLRLPAPDVRAERAIPGVSVASVTISLVLFNIVFGVANALDIAFLWSGAELPGDMKMKDYVHRGAYPLIATALLAALFVLVTLRPGSATATAPPIRRLVLVWIAQNVVLVASSVLRTLNYIDSYLLTELRIAALAWMALVALGLVLICWRIFAEKSAAWLINTNSMAALIVLSVASIVDLGSVAASWNVRHAREVGGPGAPLDLCYLHSLGPSALVPLTELAQRTPRSEFGDRVRWVRYAILVETRESQMDRNWTWRNARRLDTVDSVQSFAPAPTPTGYERTCSGRLVALPQILPVPKPLPVPEPPTIEVVPQTPVVTPLTTEQAR